MNVVMDATNSDSVDVTLFNDWKLSKLREYLKENNQLVSGSKKELIQRARGVLVLKLTAVNPPQEQAVRSLSENNSRISTFPDGQSIPTLNALSNWTSDLSNVPDFSEKDIYNYLVIKMNTKRQLKSKVFLEDKHVHSVEYSPITDTCTHCAIGCKVIPSFPSADVKKRPDYDVSVFLSKVTGNIFAAHCTCTAGSGEACNHISALIYTIADIAEKKKNGLLACTSTKCVWNNPRKRKLSPKKCSQMKFKKISYGSQPSTSTSNSTCTLASNTVATSTFNIDRFRKTLTENKSKAGWLTYFAKKKNVCMDEIPILHNILFMYHDNVDIQSSKVQNDICKYFESLSVSNAECAKSEKFTRGQNKSQNWFECRKGRLTSSNFGTICKLKPETDPKNLLKTLLYDVSYSTNKYVKWGIEHEPAARRCYCRLHPLDTVSQSGLMVSSTYPHLGCSPDGIVTLKNGESGLLEIKCPASDKWRTRSPAECGLDSDFCCSLDENQNLKLKTNHSYYFQVQGQMAICNKKWCDFVIWTLKPPLSVERIYFDESFWLKCLSKLNSFYVKSMLPELFTQRVLRSLK